MKQLSSRLVEANSVLLEADNYDIDVVEAASSWRSLSYFRQSTATLTKLVTG